MQLEPVPTLFSIVPDKAKNPEFYERAQRVLIALNDEETMLSTIKQFEEGTLPDLDTLESNLNAKNLKYLIPVIYQGSDTPRDVGFGLMQSRRRQAIALFLRRMSPEGGYGDIAISWKAQLKYYTYQKGDDPHILWLFQQWWEHNKEAILAEKFSEATWVPMYKGKPDVFADEVQKDPEYRKYTSATRNDILPIPKTADITTPTQTVSKAAPLEPPQAVAPTMENSLPIYIGLGFLLMGFVIWHFKRQLKSGSKSH